MAYKFIKIVILCFSFIYETSQVSSSPTSNPGPIDPAAVISKEKLTPTDPLEIAKIVFQPLQSNFGNFGPVMYDLVTDKNALGDLTSKQAKLIAERIGIKNFTDDMKLILDNALDPKIQATAVEIYKKIKDVSVNNESLSDAVEILTNIFNNQEIVEKIRNIIKSPKN